LLEIIAEDPNVPVVYWMWDFGDGSTSSLHSPVHQYQSPGVYTITLTMESEDGCIRVMTWKNQVEVIQNIRIYIPNAFTPNGDGLNDVFYVSSQLVNQFNIQVFDRWGAVMFESTNIGFEWNGTDAKGGALPEGVYTYRVSGRAIDNSPVNTQGTVLLIR
jgi:gliding motility-associated-like protein